MSSCCFNYAENKTNSIDHQKRCKRYECSLTTVRRNFVWPKFILLLFMFVDIFFNIYKEINLKNRLIIRIRLIERIRLIQLDKNNRSIRYKKKSLLTNKNPSSSLELDYIYSLIILTAHWLEPYTVDSLKQNSAIRRKKIFRNDKNRLHFSYFIFCISF